MTPQQSNLSASMALSPLDGRYRQRVDGLREFFSEFALSRARVRVEVEWFKRVTKLVEPSLLGTTSMIQKLDAIYQDFSLDDEDQIRKLERQTNHDVKAVEYFVKDQISAIGLVARKELVHFACTSEDITNVAYAMNMTQSRDEFLIPLMSDLISLLADLAEQNAEIAMLSRTHGQPATPTTLGKELIVAATRLTYWCEKLVDVRIRAKFNGAVGNFNAHVSSMADVDWQTTSAQFLRDLGFDQSRWTTQIEPHDWMSDFLNALVGFNQVLLDFDRDIWSYISIGYFKQRVVEGEVGSSTMPHKVNPIDFENSEGNAGVANSLARHLADKLLVSRWQRDLTDSTVLRNLGSVHGYTTLAIDSTAKGIKKLEVDVEQINADLEKAWEVLAEPVQTVMRLESIDNPYEKLKTLTRGQQLSETHFSELISDLAISEESKKRLMALKPSNYIGLAKDLTLSGVAHVRKMVSNWST